MLMVLLYGLAAFLETGIGIWIFGKMFPNRSGMRKPQIFSEWVLFTVIIWGMYSFSEFFCGVSKLQWYLPTLIVFYCFLLIIYAVNKFNTRYLGEKESPFIRVVLFAGMIFWIGCQYWISYHSALSTLLGNGLPVLYLIAFYEGSFLQKYLWESLYLTNIGLLKAVYITYAGVFKNKHFEEFIFSPRIHSYSEVIFLLVIYSGVFLLVKHIPIERIMKKMLFSYKKVLFLVTFSEWCILLVLMNFGTGKINKKNLTATLIIVVGVLFILLILFARFFGKAVNKERNLLDARNEAVECQYRELSEAYENYRCLVHDEKHMVYYLAECLASGEIENAQSFLKNYQENRLNQKKRSWTGNSTLDFMLNMKKRKMDELQVEFQLDCKIESIPMEDADFVVVLGNLFDNAIEAVEKCEVGNRKIYLSLQSVNEMFILKMKNSSTLIPNIKNNRFITNKEERSKHGWGIESIKHIVTKYSGHLAFQYDTTIFEVSIILNE
ncbi:MAG: GHKL domain-containing protein [Eubacteriales bacterium]|nr:GHKL domain-containing protein [Eubacteriales bacterium]